MPYSEGDTQVAEEAGSSQNVDSTATVEADITSDCPSTKRKRSNTSKKATQSKKKPKQGSYGSMEQFVFRINKNQ